MQENGEIGLFSERSKSIKKPMKYWEENCKESKPKWTSLGKV